MTTMLCHLSSRMMPHMPLTPAALHSVQRLSLSLSGIPLHTESLAVLVVRSTVCTKRMAIRTTRVRHRLNMGMYIPAETMTIVLGLPRWRFVFGTDEMSNPLWLPGTSPGQSRHEIFINYKWR